MQPLCCVFLQWLSNLGTRKNNNFFLEKQKTKNYKIKRSVIYQSLSSSGLNFPNFRTVFQSLRLSWLCRFLSRTNESWQAIPNDSSSYLRLANVSECLYCRRKIKCFSFNLKMGLFIKIESD